MTLLFVAIYMNQKILLKETKKIDLFEFRTVKKNPCTKYNKKKETLSI
jgi:hypothetical protein